MVIYQESFSKSLREKVFIRLYGLDKSFKRVGNKYQASGETSYLEKQKLPNNKKAFRYVNYNLTDLDIEYIERSLAILLGLEYYRWK